MTTSFRARRRLLDNDSDGLTPWPLAQFGWRPFSLHQTWTRGPFAGLGVDIRGANESM